MATNALVKQVYQIAEKNKVILYGSIIIKGDIHCILFAHYCKSTLFYKDLLKVTTDIFAVNRISRTNLRQIKKLLKKHGYRNIWTKGVFAVYGDLRPLAVKAGFGDWGENGLVVNKKYGSDFLISAIFFK